MISYLRTGLLPDGKEAVRKLKFQASRFVLIKDVLYKKGFSRQYLRCLSREEVDYVMREVHEGVCGNHSRGTVVNAQVDPNWVLLANYAERRTSLRQDLRQVSEVQQFHQPTVPRAKTHDGPLAICSIGTRYHGSLPNRG